MQQRSDEATRNGTIWVVRAGRGRAPRERVCRPNCAAIGWGDVGDLSGRVRAALTRAVRDHYPEQRSAGGTAGILWRFANEMRPGDLVITPDSETRELHVGEVTGDYEHRDPAPIEAYPHVRPVAWREHFSRDLLPRRLLYTLGGLGAVFTPGPQEELREAIAARGREVEVEESTEDINEGVDLYEEQRARNGELIRRSARYSRSRRPS